MVLTSHRPVLLHDLRPLVMQFNEAPKRSTCNLRQRWPQLADLDSVGKVLGDTVPLMVTVVVEERPLLMWLEEPQRLRATNVLIPQCGVVELVLTVC